jgi:hypothetical protein
MPDMTTPTIDLNKLAEDLGDALKEGAYIVVGLGVLGFQRAQVRRVELTKQFEAQAEQMKTFAGSFGSVVESLMESAREQGEAARGQMPDQLTDLARSWERTVAPIRERLSESLGTEIPGHALTGTFESTRAQLVEIAKVVDERVAPVRQELDKQVVRLQQRLPAGAREMVELFRAGAAAQEQAFRNVVGLN